MPGGTFFVSYGPYVNSLPCFSGSAVDVRPVVVEYSGISADENLTLVFCLIVGYADGK